MDNIKVLIEWHRTFILFEPRSIGSSQSDQIELCATRLQAIYNAKPSLHVLPRLVSPGHENLPKDDASTCDSLFQADDTRSHGVTEKISRKVRHLLCDSRVKCSGRTCFPF